MSKKFTAINRETREQWKPRKDKKEFLVMYDSGYLAVICDNGWDGNSINPLDAKVWRKEVKPSILN